MKKKEKFDIIRIIIGIVVLIPLIILNIIYEDYSFENYSFKLVVTLPISIILYLLLSYDFFIKTFKNFKKKKIFDEITLTLIASIAAFIVGEYVEAVAVCLFFQIGEKFEDYAVNKSRNSIKDVLNLRADKVTLIDLNTNIEKDIDPYDANINDIFIVKNGERVPLDGIIIKGNSFIDTSSLTGESVPRKIKENDEILSGVINKGSPLYIKAIKLFYDSTISKIMDIVENATNNKTESEKFITKFSKYYTPIVIALAFISAIIPPLFLGINDLNVWSKWVLTAANLLVVSCPCALVLSVPMAYFVGIGEASKIKMLIKGSAYLEDLNKLETVILDKTGTITKGNFVLTNIYPENNISKEEIIKLAKIAESYSLHPIALSILSFNSNVEFDKNDLRDIKEISGKGIKGFYKDKLLLVGNEELLKENKINYTINKETGTLIYVSYDNKFLGSLLIKDEIKDDSKDAIKSLYKNGIKNVYMLTGDNEKIATYVAKECSINNVASSLLPLDKVNKVKEIMQNKSKNKKVAFIGDGINDAPSMTLVDVSISMGVIGSDAAIEASDIVIMDDKLSTINKGKKIAKSTINVVYQNIIFALVIKVLAIILALSNLLGNYMIWLSIFADVGVTFLCVLNSLKLMLLYKKLNKQNKPH